MPRRLSEMQLSNKLLGYLLLIVIGFNFLFVIYAFVTVKIEYDQIDSQMDAISKQIESVKIDKAVNSDPSSDVKAIEFLEDQFANYKDFANNDRESFISLINIFFIALGVLVTGGTIVLFWMFGQTRSDIEANARKIEEEAQKTIEEAKKTVGEMEKAVDSKVGEFKEKANRTIGNAEKTVEKIIDPKVKELEEKYKVLEDYMETQVAIRNSRVLVVCPKDTIKEMNQLEVKRMKEIVSEVEVINTDQTEKFKEKIENDEVDFIVYRYYKKKKDEQEKNGRVEKDEQVKKEGQEKEEEDQEKLIREYMQVLIDKQLKIPVVIYVKSGRLNGKDEEKVNEYPFTVIANMPTTLTGNMISLATVLAYEKKAGK
ncbi:hypothetical protein [Paenibacillus faecalis]|uniref:hypothetical protein n=1 Tax=Paenibacillus faecalis TaxID=2079532 RepID=UPI000D0F1895|nr:hypothetical protein [Paenibacillus faecalis]